MANNGPDFDGAQKASRETTRRAQDSLDRIQQDKSREARSTDTGDDVNRRNVDVGRSWGNAKRNPRG